MQSSRAPNAGEVSLSIEESNRLRISLGLAPLRTTKPKVCPPASNQQHADKSARPPAPSKDMSTRLAASRQARQLRTAAIGKTDLPGKSTAVATRSQTHEDDLNAWVKRSRSIQQPGGTGDSTKRQSTSQKPFAATAPKKMKESNERINRSPTSTHRLQSTIPDDAQEGTILNLRDRPLSRPQKRARGAHGPNASRLPMSLQAESDSDSSSQEDQLEDSNKSKANQTPSDANAAFYQPYDATDTAQFEPNAEKGPKLQPKETMPSVQTLKSTTQKTIPSDYRGPPPGKSDVPKRREKRLRKKRRRQHSPMPTAASSRENLNSVSRGHVKAMRREADKNAGAGEEDDNEEDAHYKAMLLARRKAETVNSQKRLDALLNAIETANEEGGTSDSNQADGLEDGARILYDEMHAFLQRVPVPTSTASAPVNQSDDSTPIRGETATVPMEADVQAALPVEKESDLVRNAESGRSASGKSEERNLAGVENERPTGLTGIAATLQRLRQTGELAKKREKVGRSRDRPLNPGNNSDEEESQTKQVKLSYMDEYGNEVTAKEAFRLLCHKFHGNGPGKNKNEKRLKKMLESMRVKNMQVGDTPLASVAALKEETRRQQSSHVVLSGSEAFRNAMDANANGNAVHASELDEDALPSREGDAEKIQFSIGGAGMNPTKRRRR